MRASLPRFVRVTCKYPAHWVNRSLVKGHGVVEPSLLNDAIQLSKNMVGKRKSRLCIYRQQKRVEMKPFVEES